MPGYYRLQPDEFEAMFEFCIVWSVVEAKIIARLGDGGSEALNGQRICRFVDDESDRFIDLGDLKGSLDYFRARYVPDAQTNCHFEHLNFSNLDMKSSVSRALIDETADPQDVAKALLLIIFRLRNNLFHGRKWAYEMKDQKENFLRAAKVLIAVSP